MTNVADGTPIRDLLRTIAPETVSAPDETLDLFIEIATARNSPSVFGRLYRIAVAYHAAHMFIVSQRRGGIAGPLTGRRAGEVSENFGSLPGNIPWNDTTYGRMYKELLDSRPASKPFSTAPWSPPNGPTQ